MITLLIRVPVTERTMIQPRITLRMRMEMRTGRTVKMMMIGKKPRLVEVMMIGLEEGKRRKVAVMEKLMMRKSAVRKLSSMVVMALRACVGMAPRVMLGAFLGRTDE